MARFVQRRPEVQAEEYDGSREAGDRVMGAFVRPPEEHLDEFRQLLKWPESRVLTDTAYKWFWFEGGTTLDRPAVTADGAQHDTGLSVAKAGLWFGFEGQGAGTGVTEYQEIPLGYVYSGWSLKPNWMAKKDFLKDWEPFGVE